MKFLAICFSLILTFFSFAMANTSNTNAHQFSFSSIDGDEISLSDFKGKVILVVNTASKCMLTPQYKALQELYKIYGQKGLVVLAVPSADFASQEFSKSFQVKTFTEEHFQITFPLMDISKVTGKDAHPFYLWAFDKAGVIGSPKWNFHKYLIDKEGNFSDWFSSATKPTSSKMIRAIEKLL